MRRTARYITLLLASGGGVGYLPYMPGTWGTLVAIPFSLAVNRLATGELVLAVGALFGLMLVAIVLANQAGRLLATKDPQIVVVDEIAGFAAANFLTDSTTGLILAFVLFRFFDIAKVFPARQLEALPGGAGIVLDDMIAGVYTFLILRLLSLAAIV